MVKRAGGALLLGIAIEHGAARPVSAQLYASLRDLMLSGSLAAGERLPATRTLARDLGVSRTTVIDAFERLTAEGLIDSRVGSGTFVSVALAADRPGRAPERNGPDVQHAPVLSRTMASAVERFGTRQRLPHTPGAFVTALPALDEFPMGQWARIAAKHWRRARREVMGYGEPSGHPALRQTIAGHLRANRGISCDAEQIFIVAGAQQAFSLIGTLLLNPGDAVWFENPGAIGARNSLIASGAELVPVPVDQEGIRVEEGLRLCPQFRSAFVTPSHQQPLGYVMSLQRRLALLAAAERAGAWVIEDDYDSEFFYGRRPLPTLKSVDRTGRVIYVGTFSKSLFPALRLGFILAPEALVETFARASVSFVQGVATSLQGIVAEFIEEGYFATHIRRMRRIYAERHAALYEAAQRSLVGLLEIVPAESGLHTIGNLPSTISEVAAARAAAVRDIVVSPIARFSLEATALNGLVLGFGGIKPAEIRSGVERLGQALAGLQTIRRAAGGRRQSPT